MIGPSVTRTHKIMTLASVLHKYGTGPHEKMKLFKSQAINNAIFKDQFMFSGGRIQA